MAATARRINVDASAGGGSWDSIPAPSEQRVELVEVEDYDNGNTFGWIFTYAISEQPGLRSKTWLTAGPKTTAHWKIINVADAHDYPMEEGLQEFDPNALVGDTIMVTLDFDRDSDGVPESKFRNIQAFYKLPPDGFVAEEAPLLDIAVAAVPDRL